jgi:ABC-type uncharacterized transport system YnjBCD ATPase subunit
MLHVSTFFITETGNHVIRRVDLITGIISTVAGIGGVAGSSGDGGPATLAYLNGPHAVSFDATGGFWIADSDNNAVRYVDSAGIIVTRAGIVGTPGSYTGDGGLAASATLKNPTGVVV